MPTPTVLLPLLEVARVQRVGLLQQVLLKLVVRHLGLRLRPALLHHPLAPLPRVVMAKEVATVAEMGKEVKEEAMGIAATFFLAETCTSGEGHSQLNRSVHDEGALPTSLGSC
jgi:hypothetical protein